MTNIERDLIIDKILLITMGCICAFLIWWFFASEEFRIHLAFAGFFIIVAMLGIYWKPKFRLIYYSFGFIATFTMVFCLTYIKGDKMGFIGWTIANVTMVPVFGYFYVNIGEKFGPKLRETVASRGTGIFLSLACIAIQLTIKWSELLPHAGLYNIETLTENLLFTSSAVLFFESVKQ